jgi:hypothetical protein
LLVLRGGGLRFCAAARGVSGQSCTGVRSAKCLQSFAEQLLAAKHDVAYTSAEPNKRRRDLAQFALHKFFPHLPRAGTFRRWGRNNATVLFSECFKVYWRLRCDAAVFFRKRFVVHYGNLASLLNLAAASALGNVMTVPLGSVTVFPAAAPGAGAGAGAGAGGVPASDRAVYLPPLVINLRTF